MRPSSLLRGSVALSALIATQLSSFTPHALAAPKRLGTMGDENPTFFSLHPLLLTARLFDTSQLSSRTHFDTCCQQIFLSLCVRGYFYTHHRQQAESLRVCCLHTLKTEGSAAPRQSTNAAVLLELFILHKHFSTLVGDVESRLQRNSLVD
jgi:uncharacterized membrane protein